MTRPLHVMWVSPVPGSPLTFPVKSVGEGRRMIEALAANDNKHIDLALTSEYLTNSGWVEEFLTDEWIEVDGWEDA